MSFSSLHFICFLAVVYGLFLLMRHRVQARNMLLLAASYYFYGSWDWRFLGLIAASTLVAYFSGLVINVKESDIGRWAKPRGRAKAAMILSVIVNLGILAFFKYFDFFVSNAGNTLALFGLKPDIFSLRIILPVGISFYTFQTLSYSIDLYRGQVQTERNPLTFALYVAFFPQLVAGPIERATNLLPQMRIPTTITWEKLTTGFYLICWGLFKKVVIADNVASVADNVFAASNPSGMSVVIGAYAFAVQIYCDFSAYSDIARGTARCMGFELMQNFNSPYFAANPSDFWRRWHISLSTWLRDYLYIPLGGNRKGTARTYLNLMLTMILGGLWHGAGWTFAAWGVYHGFLLCMHRAVRPWLDRHVIAGNKIQERVWYLVRAGFFFHVVCISWILFRAASVSQATRMIASVFTRGFSLGGARNYLLTLGPCMAFLTVIELLRHFLRDDYVFMRGPATARVLLYTGLILAFILLGADQSHAFIYFQF